MLAMMIAAAFVPSGMAVMSEDEPGIASEGEAALLASVIRVDSEAELAELVSSGTASGSGTIADPYVIDGLEIDAAGQGAAIYIGNTTSYLRISNCTLYGASYKTEHFANGGGIILYRVQNATVENNAITSSHHGAYGEYALNIVFNGNTISAVNFYGIAISSSDLCVIDSNNVTTSNSGVSITNGDDCEVRDNLLSGNSNSGVRVDTSSNILVENNTCDNEGMFGISISNSDHLSVLDNSCVGSRRGVSMWSSSLNLIDGNVINSSTEYGILADSSHQNRFANNTVLFSYDYGFFLSYSSNNLLEGNNVSDHDRYYGVYLLLGTGNMLLNNTFLRNSLGIHMFRTSHNTVEGNVFIDNNWGMDIDTADWNLIANNSFNGGYTGIEAYSHDTVQSKGCNNNTITGNLFRGGSNYGIMFLTTEGACKNNTIEYNTFLDNFLGGVVLMEWDDDNLIVSNAFIDNYPIGSAQCSDPSLSRWNDSDSGNYWNDLTAPDDDEDGIVDIGYDLDGGNTDFYPRVSPLWIESPAHLQELGTSAMVSGVLINHHLAAEFVLENTATGETVNVTAQTHWSTEVELTTGENTLVVSMVDIDGRTYSDQIILVCTAPSVSTDPANGTTTYTSEQNFNITVDAGGWEWLDHIVVQNIPESGTPYLLSADTSFDVHYHGQFEIYLYYGLNHITVYANDSAGRSATCSLDLYYDPYPPVIEFTYLPDGSYINEVPVEITWTFVEYMPFLRDAPLVDVYYRLEGPDWIRTENGSVVFPDLDDGCYYFQIKAVDAAGNIGMNGVNFTLDTCAPSLEILTPSDGAIYSVDDVPLSIVADDENSGLAGVQYRLNGGTWTPLMSSSTTLADLADNDYLLEVKAEDYAGNENLTSVEFTMDTTAPVVTITSPADGGYADSGVVSWTVDDVSGANRTEVSIDGENWTVVSGTSHDLGLGDGTHTVYLRVTDMVGLVGEDNATFTIDSVKPTVSISSPANGAMFNVSGITVTWTGSDAASGIDRYEVRVGAGDWMTAVGNSKTLSLEDGEHNITVRAFDRAGNHQDATVSITVDTLAPAVAITAPAEGALLNSPSALVTWNITEAGGIATIDLSVDGGAWHPLAAAALSYLAEDLDDGEHTVSVRVRDAAGNQALASVTFLVDITAPTCVGHPSGDGVDPGTVITVAFSEAMDRNGTTITVAGVPGAVVWDDMNATFTPSAPLAYNWRYLVTVEGTDLAGNAMQAAWSFNTTLVGQMTGRAVDEDGAALAGVLVTLNEVNVTTGADGRFTFADLEPGNYSIILMKDGYLMGAAMVTVNGNQTSDLGNITMEAVVLLGTVSGTLLDEDGEPMAGVAVGLGMMIEITDANGNFSFQEVPAGTYQFTVDHEGYQILHQVLEVDEGEEMDLGDLTLVAEEEEDDGGNTIIVVAAVIVLAVAAAGVLLFLRRRP